MPEVDIKKFNPDEFLITVQGGKKYLEVAWRLVWFRQEHPDWGIYTKPLEINKEKGYAIFTAIVTDQEGNIRGQGTKHEDMAGFSDYIEKAETGAIGRALAVCGFGTQWAPELLEGERLVDAPRTPRGSGGGAKSSATYPCSGCQDKVNEAVKTYSEKRYGYVLCVPCQRAADKAQEDGGSYAG